LAVSGTDPMIAAVLIAAACLLTCLYSRRMFKQSNADLQRKTQEEFKALKRSIEALEARILDLSRAAPAPAASTTPISPVKTPVQPGTVIPFPSAGREGVSPETVVVIAAAVTAFLGKKVRIRSAKRLQSPYEIVNPWAQQGRVIVQASHNLLSGPRSERSFTERSAAVEVANRH